MKRKKLFGVVGIVIFIMIAIVACMVLFGNKDDDVYDNTIAESDMHLLTLHKNNLLNGSELSYEAGDRVNIILKETTVELEYDDKKPYMENVKIYKVSEEDLSLWVPFDYGPFAQGMQGSPLITIEIAKATDSKGPFKVNKDYYNALYDKYALKPDEKIEQ